MSIGDIMNIELPLTHGSNKTNKSMLPDVASCCPLQKLSYESCFQKWYIESFLQLKHIDTSNNVPQLGCINEFNVYQQCVRNHIKTLDPDIQEQISDELKDN